MATPKPNRKARRKWSSVVKRRTFPVDGCDGVFVYAPTWDQLEEFEDLIEAQQTAERKAEKTGAVAIIEWLWSHLVVDEEGELFDYQPGDVDLAQLEAVKNTIRGICSGEAVGTPGEAPPPTS